MEMKAVFIGNSSIILDKVASTNSYLAELLIEQNLPEGTAVTAYEQGGGRGQRGTQWESEPGKNITLSLLLKPIFLEIDSQFELSKMVALAVSDFIKHLLNEHHSQVRIKWPNDIYLDKKKVAGILIENTLVANKIAYSIIGIGININQQVFSSQLVSATSVRNSTGKEYDLDTCREQLYYFMEKRYVQLRSQLRIIENDYLNHLLFFNEWAMYLYKEEKIKAKITGINKTGKLILQRENAEVYECDIKEIQIVL